MDYLAIIQAAIRYGSDIKGIIDASMTNVDIVTKIKALSDPLASVLENIGAQFFPKAAPEFHIAAAVTAAFDPNITKWLQGSMNAVCTPSPGLVVDGIYGPRTKAAVEKLQEQAGIKVDGWAGQVTQAAISTLLGAMSKNDK